MPAYHSQFNSETSYRTVGNMVLLPIRTRVRGPAPQAPQTQDDIIDEALDLFRANCLFRNFEIKGNADRVLIYLILFISDCLNRLTKNTNQKDAVKVLNTRALDNFALPGEPQFPLNALYAAPATRGDAGKKRLEKEWVDDED
ncbi:229_t:CDS:2 [Paraglomus brasilianum]|uniref:Actin-related protein 2/3 complex subunit 3 n=1 Tax=Paraglomus brasilianum TaxID=144538 RepID=A0A9N8ZBF8_9GLOM|nr:229_t:CDS:2 [Paraglomus brasilianum]